MSNSGDGAAFDGKLAAGINTCRSIAAVIFGLQVRGGQGAVTPDDQITHGGNSGIGEDTAQFIDVVIAVKQTFYGVLTHQLQHDGIVAEGVDAGAFIGAVFRKDAGVVQGQGVGFRVPGDGVILSVDLVDILAVDVHSGGVEVTALRDVGAFRERRAVGKGQTALGHNVGDDVRIAEGNAVDLGGAAHQKIIGVFRSGSGIVHSHVHGIPVSVFHLDIVPCTALAVDKAGDQNTGDLLLLAQQHEGSGVTLGHGAVGAGGAVQGAEGGPAVVADGGEVCGGVILVDFGQQPVHAQQHLVTGAVVQGLQVYGFPHGAQKCCVGVIGLGAFPIVLCADIKAAVGLGQIEVEGLIVAGGAFTGFVGNIIGQNLVHQQIAAQPEYLGTILQKCTVNGGGIAGDGGKIVVSGLCNGSLDCRGCRFPGGSVRILGVGIVGECGIAGVLLEHKGMVTVFQQGFLGGFEQFVCDRILQIISKIQITVKFQSVHPFGVGSVIQLRAGDGFLSGQCTGRCHSQHQQQTQQQADCLCHACFSHCVYPLASNWLHYAQKIEISLRIIL